MAKLIRFIKRWILNNVQLGYVLRQDEEDNIVNGKLFHWRNNIKHNND